MPCYTISLVKLKLAASNVDYLTQALTELGFSPTWNTDKTVVSWGFYGESFNRQTGEIRVRNAETVSKIQVQYQKVQLFANAKKFGWQIKQDSKQQNKYQIIKR